MDSKLQAAVTAGAKAAHLDEEDFIEAIFRYRKREYELQDVKNWMQDNSIYSDISPEMVLKEFYHHEDCNLDYWTNIKNAYDRVRGYLH